MDPQLEDLLRRQPRPTQLLKIDLSDRNRAGPVAQQHGIRAIPRLVLYDGQQVVARDTGAVLARLRQGLR